MSRLVVDYPDICCLIIGEGRKAKRLRRMIESFGLENNVRMLGYRHDAVHLLKAVDVAVLPSLREGLGIVLIEAGFLGKPTVASNIPGINDVVISGETGVLVPPANAEALATGIRTLLDDPLLARDLGIRARRRMQGTFTLETMAAEAEMLYRRVIADYRQRNA